VIGVREKTTGSWLDPAAAGLLGWKLGKRLWERCQGEKGLFLTLTYRRDEYAEAKFLYWRQSERQDVPLFLRKLARATGLDFKGKWLCKIEFQRGGWVHFHILLLGVEYLDSDVVARCWEHGFVKVQKMTKKSIFYLTKYVAKAGELPWYLYLERPRSFKAVRVSPGFWGEGTSRPSGPPDEKPGRYLADVWTPLYEKLRKGRGVQVRGKFGIFSRRCCPGTFICLLGSRRRCVGQREGYLWFNATEADVDAVAAACTRVAAPSHAAGEPPPRSGGLNLIQTSNPDAPIPKWLAEVWKLKDDQERALEVALIWEDEDQRKGGGYAVSY
jgi:hypothetical protein